MHVFKQSKDVQVLTLINLLDNILPLVLNIYLVVFNSNNLEIFIDAMLRAWVVFVIYRIHHYNKAPLVFLSNVLYWKKSNHPLYEALKTHLQIDDQYALKNFQSVLRAQISIGSTPEEISKKAREISATNGILHQFKTQFVPPKSAKFSQNQLKSLKAKAARFILNVFSDIHANPGTAKNYHELTSSHKRSRNGSCQTYLGSTKLTTESFLLAFKNLVLSQTPTSKLYSKKTF